MPITLAHPAAVLALRRLHLPMAAMVFGSTVPDVPLFMGWATGYAVSHSLPGVITVNLVVALAGLCAWNIFVRDALVDMAPDMVRVRLAPRHRLTLQQWLLAPAAAVVGSLTHLVWDAFTHPGRWGVTHLALLRTDFGPLPGFKWAQYVSGVIGLGVVLWAVIADLRSRSAGLPLRRRVLPAPVLPAVIFAAGTYGVVAGLARANQGLHVVAFNGVVQCIVATSASVLITCAAWVLAKRLQAMRA